jgi:hypothetical protein
MMSGSAKRGGKRTRAVRASGAPAAMSTATAPRYAAINGLITVRDRQKLQFLSRRTRVPQSEYLREAIRDLLAKYRDVFDDSPFEDDEPL